MPIYEYACRSCGQHLEIAQSFMDDSLTSCPACEGPLRKVYGSIGITFKGSGFYRTDSRGASTNGAKIDKGEKAGADKSGTAGAKGDGGKEGSGAKPSEASPSRGADAKGSNAKAASAKAASA